MMSLVTLLMNPLIFVSLFSSVVFQISLPSVGFDTEALLINYYYCENDLSFSVSVACMH